MSKPDPARVKKKAPRFPWVIFLLLLGSIYVFWILPRQLGPRPVHVEFVDSK